LHYSKTHVEKQEVNSVKLQQTDQIRMKGEK